MKDCTHGFASPASCLTCMTNDGLGAAPVVPDAVVATFSARYGGECFKECGDLICPGDLVHRLEPSERYVHVGCWNVVA